MKQLIFLSIFLLLATMYANAQTSVVTMTTTSESVGVHVKWTGAGSLIANGLELKNDFITVNTITATSDGSVALMATGDVQLTHLWCHYNSLSTLDVTNCPKLTVLWCQDNSLTNLDVTNCTELAELRCNDNSLTDLDVTNCTKLEILHCDDNSLTALDVTNCPELESLCCNDNSLTALDVTICTKLKGLNCDNNFLSALDVSKCTELLMLLCYDNFLSALDITNCPKLRELFAYHQTPTLPEAKTQSAELSIKNPIMFNGTKVRIDNISHHGIYSDSAINWKVRGKRGTVTFDFATELPEKVTGIPFSGTATQAWKKKK